MTLPLRLLSPLRVLAALAVAAVIASCSSASAVAATAQYCIAQSGANGEASYVGNCVYSDYQQCIAAAAQSRGNCVGNINYRGEAEPAAPTRRRRR
jgi:hypothetical protein